MSDTPNPKPAVTRVFRLTRRPGRTTVLGADAGAGVALADGRVVYALSTPGGLIRLEGPDHPSIAGMLSASYASEELRDQADIDEVLSSLGVGAPAQMADDKVPADEIAAGTSPDATADGGAVAQDGAANETAPETILRVAAEGDPAASAAVAPLVDEAARKKAAQATAELEYKAAMEVGATGAQADPTSAARDEDDEDSDLEGGAS